MVEVFGMTADWINAIDEKGQTLIAKASTCGRTEISSLLVIQDFQDEWQNFRDLPDLHRAACWGFADVISELIGEGADVNADDIHGESALHKASRFGNLEAARELLEREADPDAIDSLGMTPLHWAAVTGNVEIVDLLLSFYANSEVRDHFAGGMTPLGMAKLLGNERVVELMRARCWTF